MLTVYTKDGCVHCQYIKDKLTYHEIPFRLKELDKDVTLEWLKETFPHARSFPIVESVNGTMMTKGEVDNYIQERTKYDD